MCEEGQSDGGTEANQVGLGGAVYILIGEVSGKDSDGAGGETGDRWWVSERWVGVLGLPRVLAGSGVDGESLGRGGRGKGQRGGRNLGRGQKETSGKMYQMCMQDVAF